MCLPHGLLDFRYILNAPRIRYIPNKKETHHVEPINSQEDPKWWTSFVYIGPEVCQLLNHYTYINCVKNKIGHKPSGGQIVKSHKISVFILLPCKIISSNGNRLSRPNHTETLILCQFYLQFHHMRLLKAW